MYAGLYQKVRCHSSPGGILSREGIQVVGAHLGRAHSEAEAWFERKLRENVQVTICKPKLIGTDLDVLSHPSLIFYHSGYSLHTLRDASRRSWRIGQPDREGQPVGVFHIARWGDDAVLDCESAPARSSSLSGVVLAVLRSASLAAMELVSKTRWSSPAAG